MLKIPYTSIRKVTFYCKNLHVIIEGAKLCFSYTIVVTLFSGSPLCASDGKLGRTWKQGFHIKAIDKWVLGGAEAPPNFWHLYLKDVAQIAQHTTAYDM